jgi:hypothetical protein
MSPAVSAVVALSAPGSAMMFPDGYSGQPSAAVVVVGAGDGVAVAVGAGVGVGLGFAVGVAVGNAVGVAVGNAVGVAVGAVVGVAVGSGVGEAIATGVATGLAVALPAIGATAVPEELLHATSIAAAATTTNDRENSMPAPLNEPTELHVCAGLRA